MRNRSREEIKRQIKEEQEAQDMDEVIQRKLEEKKEKQKAEATRLEKYADEGFLMFCLYLIYEACRFGLIAFVLYLAYLFLYQNSILYHHQKHIEQPTGQRSPHELENGLGYYNLTLKTSDGVAIKGWFMFQEHMPRGEDSTPTLVYMHENEHSNQMRLPLFNYLVHHCHVNVLAMAYRGYSESEGVAHEEGLKKDADAIMDFIADPTVNQEISAKLNSKMVFVHGKGLGAALAIYMAHEREHLWQGLIAENAFTTVRDVVDHRYFFGEYFRWLVRNHWDNRALVGDLNLPILYIAGRNDGLVPYEQSKELYQLSTKVNFKKQYIVPTGRHHNLFFTGGATYAANITEFIFKSLDKYEPGLLRGQSKAGKEQK